MTCTADKHDLRFVHQLEDDVNTTTFYPVEGGPPTITEFRRTRFECRLCGRMILGTWHRRTYQPEPKETIYEDGQPLRYVY